MDTTVQNSPVQPQPQIHRVKLEAFLRKQQGRVVGLDFIKLDGSFRPLNGRLGVRKHLRTTSSEPSNVSGPETPYLVIYDLQKRGYRSVNLSTVSAVRAQNTCYTVIG